MIRQALLGISLFYGLLAPMASLEGMAALRRTLNFCKKSCQDHPVLVSITAAAGLGYLGYRWYQNDHKRKYIHSIMAELPKEIVIDKIFDLAQSKKEFFPTLNRAPLACLSTIKKDCPLLHSAAFSPDSKLIVTLVCDNLAYIWNTHDGALLRTLPGPGGTVKAAAFSPDSKRIVLGSSGGTVGIWRVSDGETLNTIQNLGTVNFVAFSADGTRILALNAEGTAHILNASDCTVVRALPGHTSMPNSAAFSHDSQRIAMGSYNGTAHTLNASDGNVLHTLNLNEHRFRINAVIFSPDSTRIAAASGNGTTHILNASDCTILYTLNGHHSSVSSVAFSPDGAYILRRADDGTACLWNAHNGQLLRTLQGGSYYKINSAVFSLDSKHILTANTDGIARILNIADGMVLHTMRAYDALNNSLDSGVIYAEFSTNGKHVVTASDDGITRIWASPFDWEKIQTERHYHLLLLLEQYKKGASIALRDIAAAEHESTVKAGSNHSKATPQEIQNRIQLTAGCLRDILNSFDREARATIIAAYGITDAGKHRIRPAVPANNYSSSSSSSSNVSRLIRAYF